MPHWDSTTEVEGFLTATGAGELTAHVNTPAGKRAGLATYLEVHPLGMVELEIWVHGWDVPAGQSLG